MEHKKLLEKRIHGRFNDAGQFVDASGVVIPLELSNIGSQVGDAHTSTDDKNDLENELGDSTLGSSNYQENLPSDVQDIIDKANELADKLKNGEPVSKDEVKDLLDKMSDAVDKYSKEAKDAQGKQAAEDVKKAIDKARGDLEKAQKGSTGGNEPGDQGNKGQKGKSSSKNKGKNGTADNPTDESEDGDDGDQGDESEDGDDQDSDDDQSGNGGQQGQSGKQGKQGNNQNNQQGASGNSGNDENPFNNKLEPDPNAIYVDVSTNFRYKWNGKEFERYDD